MEPKNEEFHSASYSVMQGNLQVEGEHASTRTSEVNISEVKPMLKYSIQTGEEFALEFMQDWANPRKPMPPNIIGDYSNATGYMELNGILGISHTVSESGSNMSMMTMVDKDRSDFAIKNSFLYENRSNYGLVQSIGITSNNDSMREVLPVHASSGTSSSFLAKMKVLCSFGGRILRRPSDGKLRYVGGETRIIRIARDIAWRELLQKTSLIFNEAHVIKYQLPGEDLDALVSVTCDEDLHNMMEECNDLEDREGSQKLRIFLCSTSYSNDARLAKRSTDGDSEVQYVVAVNGMEIGSGKKSSILSEGNSHLTGNFIPSSGDQGSTAATSILAYGDYPILHGVRMMHPVESMQYPLHYGYDPSDNSIQGQNQSQLPQYGLINGREFVNGGQTLSQENYSKTPLRHVKKAHDGSFQKSNSAKNIPMERKLNIPTRLSDGNLKSRYPEASVTAPVREGQLPCLASKDNVRHQENDPSGRAINTIQIPISNENDSHGINSSSSYGLDPDSNAESNIVDPSCHEGPPQPKQIYYSERIPTRQEELLNLSSKSDDTRGSEFFMAHFQPGISQQDLTECSDKFLERNLSIQNENAADYTGVDAVTEFHRHEITNANSQINPRLQHGNPDLKQALLRNAGSKNASDRDPVMKFHLGRIHSSDNLNEQVCDASTKTMLETHSLYKEYSVQQKGDPILKLPEIDCDVESGKESSVQVLHQTLNMTRDASEKSLSHFVLKPAQGDILIGIDDRFPRDFLPDTNSEVISEESSDVNQSKDGTGLHLNMENHEPNHQLYFQKSTHVGIDDEGVSHTEHDHINLPSNVRKLREKDNKPQYVTCVSVDGVPISHVERHLDLVEDLQVPEILEGHNTVLHSDYGQMQVNMTESMQFESMIENLAMQQSEYEDVEHESTNIGIPQLEVLGDLDISTLQVIKNEDLEELRELGSGTFGTVYHGKWRGTDVAIKRIKKSCFTGRSSEAERLTIEFWREADILSKLHHPNVVAFYGVVQDRPGGTLATVTEFMVNGSLRRVLLRKDRYLDHRKKLIIAMDAAFGMEYLHTKNIVHFDLKCDNLLVNMKDPLRPICKVGDFGLSKMKHNTLVSGGVRGTLPWMAPELLNGNSNKVSEKVDVFSFGIVLWEILTGEEPYANMHYGAIIGGIVNNTLRPTIPSYCDNEWRRLMEECWAPNPAARPSFTEIAGCLREMSAAASQPKTQGQKASR